MICEVSIRTGVPVEDVLGRSRMQEIAIVRQLYWKLLRDKKGYTVQIIGRLCERNHSTVISGIKHVNGLLDVNDEYMVRIWDKIKGIEA